MTLESKPTNTKEEILTTSDVAAELRCSKAHVCKVIRGQVSGVARLPAIHMGRRVLIRRSSLEQWKIDSEAGAEDRQRLAGYADHSEKVGPSSSVIHSRRARIDADIDFTAAFSTCNGSESGRQRLKRGTVS